MMKMRKSLVWLCASVFVLSGCTTSGDKKNPDVVVSDTTQSTAESGIEGMEELEAMGDIEVDKGLFNVTITVPKDMMGEITQEELDASVEEKGFKSATLNSDGSATYVMTKSQHETMMDEMRENINESMAEMVGSESTPNITSVVANDNFTSFTVTTKNTSPDFVESMSVLALYMYGGLYAVYNGDNVENIHVDFVNADSGEIISSADSENMGNN